MPVNRRSRSVAASHARPPLVRFDDLPTAHRRLKILDACAREEGLPLNCESSLRTDNADIKWLLRKVYIELRRTRPGTKSRMT